MAASWTFPGADDQWAAHTEAAEPGDRGRRRVRGSALSPTAVRPGASHLTFLSLRWRLSNGGMAGLAPYDCHQNAITRPTSSGHRAWHKQALGDGRGARGRGHGRRGSRVLPGKLAVPGASVAQPPAHTSPARAAALPGVDPAAQLHRPVLAPRAVSRCRRRRHHGCVCCVPLPCPQQCDPRQPALSSVPKTAPGTRSLNTSPSKARALKTETREENRRRRKNSQPAHVQRLRFLADENMRHAEGA